MNQIRDGSPYSITLVMHSERAMAADGTHGLEPALDRFSVLVLLLIHTISVLSLQLKKLR